MKKIIRSCFLVLTLSPALQAATLVETHEGLVRDSFTASLIEVRDNADGFMARIQYTRPHGTLALTYNLVVQAKGKVRTDINHLDLWVPRSWQLHNYGFESFDFNPYSFDDKMRQFYQFALVSAHENDLWNTAVATAHRQLVQEISDDVLLSPEAQPLDVGIFYNEATAHKELYIAAKKPELMNRYSHYRGVPVQLRGISSELANPCAAELQKKD